MTAVNEYASWMDAFKIKLNNKEFDSAIYYLYLVIENSNRFSRRQVSDAYLQLGHIANVFLPSLDGGFLGVGFYALSLLHDKTNFEARKSLLEVLSLNTPEKFNDDPLLRGILQQLDDC